jgi:CIC family chloride channel protein
MHERCDTIILPNGKPPRFGFQNQNFIWFSSAVPILTVKFATHRFSSDTNVRRNSTIFQSYFQLGLVAAFTGLAAAVLAYSLKHFTEFFEHAIFYAIEKRPHFPFLIVPLFGLAAIFFCRKYFFKNKKNKGITEIYKTLDQRKEHLPLYKIPSHYLNGFLTVITGGSTGIEVSTVVATATVGNMAYKQEYSARVFKRELTCAGVAAGVAVLFANPLAGWLFSVEVIAKKTSKPLLLSCTVSALVAWVFIFFFDNQLLVPVELGEWHWHAIPLFALLGFLGSLLAVYFTLLVTKIKALSSQISSDALRIGIGGLAVGLLIFLFPTLYGDSYIGMNSALEGAQIGQFPSFWILLAIVLLKPLAASLTLGAGGDGGVFAPSIAAGAFLGLLFASSCNSLLGIDLIPLNCALVGMAATLSGALHAPFTSLVLICGILPNGYQLFVPILIGSLISRFVAAKLLTYNAYTYEEYLKKEKGMANA